MLAFLLPLVAVFGWLLDGSRQSQRFPSGPLALGARGVLRLPLI